MVRFTLLLQAGGRGAQGRSDGRQHQEVPPPRHPLVRTGTSRSPSTSKAIRHRHGVKWSSGEKTMVLPLPYGSWCGWDALDQKRVKLKLDHPVGELVRRWLDWEWRSMVVGDVHGGNVFGSVFWIDQSLTEARVFHLLFLLDTRGFDGRWVGCGGEAVDQWAYFSTRYFNNCGFVVI